MLMRLNSTFCRARNPYDFLSIQRGVWARDKTDDNGNINRSRIRIEETLWKAKKGPRLTDVLFWWRNIQESRYWTWNEFFEKKLKVSIVNSKWVFLQGSSHLGELMARLSAGPCTNLPCKDCKLHLGLPIKQKHNWNYYYFVFSSSNELIALQLKTTDVLLVLCCFSPSQKLFTRVVRKTFFAIEKPLSWSSITTPEIQSVYILSF